MTCCVVGKHPQVEQIDRLIRAQQAASARGEAMTAMSYSQIARAFSVPKPSLLRHRDGCLARERSTEDAGPVQASASSVAANVEKPNHFAGPSRSMDRSSERGPGAGTDDAQSDGGRVTGPSRSGTDRHNMSRSSVPSPAQSGAEHGAGVVVVSEVDGRSEAVEVPSTAITDDNPVRARARESGRKGWEKVANDAIQQAARNLANATHDVAISDPSIRAHGSYIEEIAEIVQLGEWEDERTVQRLTRAWHKSRLFVLQCHRDACSLIRIARGSRTEQVESSAARWMNIYRIAIASDDPNAQRVAAEALKGRDRVLGLIETGTKVQVNIAQSDDARFFVSIFLEEARNDPALLERIRRRMEAARERLGDPTALLTTGEPSE